MNKHKQTIQPKAFMYILVTTILSVLANITPASAEVRIGFGVSLGRSVIVGTTRRHSRNGQCPSPSSEQIGSAFSDTAQLFSGLPDNSGENSGLRNDVSLQNRISRQNEAIDLYNRGANELNKQNFSESTKWFREALKVNPALDAAHEALGAAYYELREFDKAVLELQIALQNGSSQASTLFFAGGSYAQTGNYKEAARLLRRYLNSSRAPEYLDSAQRELSIIEHQCLSKPDGDYFTAASQGGICCWPASAMPLKVFINENPKAKGYTPEFAHSLRQSFQEWSDISQKKVSFVFTNNVDQADIKCDWSDDVTKFGDTQELGLTRILSDGETGLISSAEISLYSFIDRSLRSSDMLLRTAKSVQLHEIGHALGLGHSQCDYDVMYALSSPEGLEFPLNARDRNTISTLYSSLETEAMLNQKSLGSQSLLRKD